ncbi:MAG TPA: tetratricopeptide repeat protein [Methyloceanibacter sp.]
MRFAIVLLIALAAWTFPAQADDSADWQLCTGAGSTSNTESCTRIIERGESSDSDLSVAYSNRGLGNANLGDNDSAIADLGQALRLDPRNAIAYNNRGFTYNNKGEYDRAIADLDQAIALNPENDTAYNNRGFGYNSKGEYDRAIADLDRALRLNPQNASA